MKAADRGSVVVVVCGIVALVAALGVGVARLGVAGAVRARAQLAADAAALAAAGELRDGNPPAAAVRAAAEAAQENGARLLNCTCDGTFALVEVLAPLGRIPFLPRATRVAARAEFHPECPG